MEAQKSKPPTRKHACRKPDSDGEGHSLGEGSSSTRSKTPFFWGGRGQSKTNPMPAMDGEQRSRHLLSRQQPASHTHTLTLSLTLSLSLALSLSLSLSPQRHRRLAMLFQTFCTVFFDFWQPLTCCRSQTQTPFSLCCFCCCCFFVFVC